MKVLLIDDDRDFSDAIYQHLSRKGFDVEVAYDGVKGLEKFNATTPDLVITDIVMPEQDGLGFLMAIRDDSFHFPCKVIAISGGGRIAGKAYLELADTFGVDASLTKPIAFKDLYEIFGQIGLLDCADK